MDIIKLSKLGESQTLEFKRNVDSLDAILKSIIAFANTAGGILLIGIEDDGLIVGVEHEGKLQEKLANSISNRIKPQLFPDFSVVEIKGKVVIAIQVEHSLGPYYLNDKGIEKSVYLRIGNSNRLAGPEVIAELQRVNHYPSFDMTPCDHVSESGLDKTKIQTIYAKRGKTIETEKLISAGLLVKQGKKIVATNGGVILSPCCANNLNARNSPPNYAVF